MPVVSPHRSGSSLTGSYRSTLGSGGYYGSGGSYPRYSFSERYTSTSYRDSDGRKSYTRTASITEDGVTTRYREDSREGSLRRDSISRDSGIGSIRENSILDTKRDRDSSLTRSSDSRNRYTGPLSVIDSVADIRNKYSPSNYVPAIYRNKENISRSKSINDIGLPPIERAEQSSSPASSVRKKVTRDGVNCNNSLTEFSNSTNDNGTYLTGTDDNGNDRSPPVSEIRKRFENGGSTVRGGASYPSWKDRAKREEAEARRKQSKSENEGVDNKKTNGETVIPNGKHENDDDDAKQKRDDVLLNNKFDAVDAGDVSKDAAVNGLDIQNRSKSTVSEGRDKSNDGLEVGGRQRRQREVNENVAATTGGSANAEEATNGTEGRRNGSSRVNNFSSYIPTKDYEKGDVAPNRDDRNDMSNVNRSRLYQHEKTSNDLTTSPRLNRASIDQNSSGPSGVGTRTSLNRADDERANGGYERATATRITSSPVRHQGLNGLKNIGNTCFMNSVIQCLSNTRPLLEYVRRDAYIGDINTSISSMKGALIKAFSQVIKELWSEDSADRVVNTVSLKSQIQRFAPRFMGYSQQDAQEFLRYLLEGLHEDVNRVTTKPAPIHAEIDEKLSDAEKATESWQRYLRMDNSKVVDIFVGQLKSTLRCTFCGHCSVTFDPFWDLSLPIPQKVGPIRLQQCLESFTREETLDGDEKPTCSKCKERRKCTKSFSIQKFPKILVIHLKRFSPTERFRGKLSVTVDFPLEGLDMSNYSADNRTQCRYNLYAISNHSGTTYSGHYTAYCRHPYSSAWHEYNDSRVSSISAKSTVSGEAYVLFYELDGQKTAHL